MEIRHIIQPRVLFFYKGMEERLLDHKTRPSWLKKRLVGTYSQNRVSGILRDLRLNTVCQGALCPNIAECFDKGTATFMILGDICTRNCRFCAVTSGEPLPVDEDESRRLAAAVRELSLRHVVVTSVTRDDLPDGGAGHFARVVSELRRTAPGTTVEILTPDFQGSEFALRIVVSSRPDVFNHNIETVPRLYPTVRPMADYHRSLYILRRAKEMDQEIRTKSGIMLGLGEERAEVSGVLGDLRDVNCDILTVGQYLRPSKAHLEIQDYVRPKVFQEIAEEAKGLGFTYVASAPFVRSSYNAAEAFDSIGGRGNRE